MSTLNSSVAVHVFLNANLENFRYEKGDSLDIFRLFHCTPPEGNDRFSLYFSAYEKIGNEELVLKVTLSNVETEFIQTHVSITWKEGFAIYAVPKSAKPSQEVIISKICDILNYHPPSRAILPI